MEFNPTTHEYQAQGKKIRSKGKTLLLGLNYGMGVQSLADRTGETVERAQEIIDEYYSGFAGIGKYTKDSQEMLKKLGYVTDAWGRRRRLPDAQLPEVEVIPKDGKTFFNPLIGSVEHRDAALEAKMLSYEDKYKKAKWRKDKEAIKLAAEKDGLTIKNNSGFISKALRQCLNARIQGSSASMTKVAMRMINDDQLLNSLDFHLLASIHDEVFGECPVANADEAAKRLGELMIEAAKLKCGACPWKVDPYILVDGWYSDENLGVIKNTYDKLILTMSSDEAINSIISNYTIYNPDSVRLACLGEYKEGEDSLKYGPKYYRY